MNPSWPCASDWLATGPGSRSPDLAVLGVPADRTSPSATGADATPAAVRAALARFSTYATDGDIELRDGVGNGSPVRRLVEAGMAGGRVVQLGLADFRELADLCPPRPRLSVTVVTAAELAARLLTEVMAEALDVAGSGSGPCTSTSTSTSTSATAPSSRPAPRGRPVAFPPPRCGPPPACGK